MIFVLLLGVVLLAGAAVVGAVGVFGNCGAGHQIGGGPFKVFGHSFHGSAGQLFFWGLVVGAAGLGSAAVP